jgi:RimJ/RimL family protein N-acetyltransferase
VFTSPPPRIVLRSAVPADRADLISWFPSHADAVLFGGSAIPWPMEQAHLAAREAQDDVLVYTAVLAGGDHSPAGHIELVRASPGRVHFARIGIAPHLRGTGLARGLLQAAVEIADGLGAETITLNVAPGNEPALNAYRRAGFVDRGRNPLYPEYILMERSRS